MTSIAILIKVALKFLFIFKVNKSRRQHLHQQIEQHHCEIRHETERVGSPQTLVFTKTMGTYQNQVKQQQLEIEALEKLKKLKKP